ncbi:MAG: hypothetical protein P4L51_03660 [Puia sp.]|nr:hypothetical protein [Puia sp.]
MKKQAAIGPFLFFFIVQAAVLSPFVAGAQKDVSGIPIPMKKGILFYENSYPAGGGAGASGSAGAGTSQDRALYRKALDWFAQTFPGEEGMSGTGDKATGKQVGEEDYAHTFIDSQSPGSITRKETFKVLTGDTAVNYYYITVTMKVVIQNGGYTLQVYDFYEKPIQKGITNDYSKIEYRWWDFRQGKPWFNTDKALFTGLNDQTMAYIDSFHREMASL